MTSTADIADITGLPRTAREALATGLTRYYTGKPCKHGHVAPRSARNGTCTACMQAASAAWKTLNPAPRLAQQRRWKAKRPDYHRVWYADNAEQRRAESRQYKRDNPEMRRKHEIARRARMAGAEGYYTVADIERITEMQGGKCACCGKPRKLTVDHIVALANGGSNWPRNIQMLCKSCNSSKLLRDNSEFMRTKGALL